MWTDKNGKVWRVEDMEDRHLVHTICFLEARYENQGGRVTDYVQYNDLMSEAARRWGTFGLDWLDAWIAKGIRNRVSERPKKVTYVSTTAGTTRKVVPPRVEVKPKDERSELQRRMALVAESEKDDK